MSPRHIGPMNCQIYKSSRTTDMYLFVSTPDALEQLDPIVLERFGTPIFVMTLDLTDDRQLARTDTATVRTNIERLGFHLQMPPHADNWAHWDNMKAGIRAIRSEKR